MEVLHIQRASDELLSVEEARSTQPCTAWNRADESVRNGHSGKRTEKAKYYKLTAAGKRELQEVEKRFEQLVKGVRAMLRNT